MGLVLELGFISPGCAFAELSTPVSPPGTALRCVRAVPEAVLSGVFLCRACEAGPLARGASAEPPVVDEG